MTDTTYINLRDYDWIVINSSAGKDSQAQLDKVNRMAGAQGVKHRIVVVHCDLGRVEWAGTRELAGEQARHYGNRFEVVANPRDFLERVEARGKWPGPGPARYCTSEFKTNQVKTLFTALAKETRSKLDGGNGNKSKYRVRILDCLGIRAQESDERAKKAPFVEDMETKYHKNGKVKERNSRRQVDRWFPIFNWSEDDVWSAIKASGVPHHQAYDLGMPRLSCVFCFYAPESALLLAGHHNRELLSEYVRLETKMGHTFKHKLALIQIEDKLIAGHVPAGRVTATDWDQCGA